MAHKKPIFSYGDAANGALKTASADLRSGFALRYIPFTLLVALAASLLLYITFGAGISGAESMEMAVSEGEVVVGSLSATPLAVDRPEDDRTIFLPYVSRYVKPPTSVFGVEINTGLGSSLADKAADVGTTWVRYSGLYWSDVEKVQGQYDWSALSGFETNIKALQRKNLNTSVIVLGAPDWAQKRPPYQCGAIAEGALDDFANFMHQLVKRYSVSPYFIKHWELGNEPDIDPSFVQPTNFFGCWGDLTDPYYGGEYYATMLKAVYPAIKAADPDAQVMLGGLLLDCDPANPPDNSPDNCLSGKFFEGILKGGGGDYFDIVAFHAYTHWWDNGLDDDLTHGKWDHLGGAFLGKVALLRSVMAQYNVDKPLLMNEGGLLCYPTNPDCPSDKFSHAQAAYVIKLYSRTWANNVAGAVWYTLNGPGWRDGGLLDGSTPRPAYTTFKFFSGLLKNARYVQTISTAQLEAYEFARGNKTYRVFWSNREGLTGVVPVPTGAQVYDLFGAPAAGVSSTVTVGTDPIILVTSQ